MAKTEQTEPKSEQEPKARQAPQLPAGEGRIEFRQKDTRTPLPELGRVVKTNWGGRVCGRQVRVYRGAAEASLPDAVKQALAKDGIEIGVVTYEELGFHAPKQAQPAFVNLTQQQLAKAASS